MRSGNRTIAPLIRNHLWQRFSVKRRRDFAQAGDAGPALLVQHRY
jgi:hypothetical protein